jgi:hypothetical protein
MPGSSTDGSTAGTEQNGNLTDTRYAEVRDSADFSLLLARAAANGAAPTETSSQTETLSLCHTTAYVQQRSRPLPDGRIAAWQEPCGCLLHPRVIGPTAVQQGRLRPEDRNNFSWTRRDGAA